MHIIMYDHTTSTVPLCTTSCQLFVIPSCRIAENDGRKKKEEESQDITTRRDGQVDVPVCDDRDWGSVSILADYKTVGSGCNISDLRRPFDGRVGESS